MLHTLTINNHTCNITLEAEEQIQVLQALQANPEKYDEAFRKEAARLLLDLANDWAEEGEIAEEDFARRIVMEEILIDQEGEITVYFSDDDIFLGHSIVLYTDILCETTDATIAG